MQFDACVCSRLYPGVAPFNSRFTLSISSFGSYLFICMNALIGLWVAIWLGRKTKLIYIMRHCICVWVLRSCAFVFACRDKFIKLPWLKPNGMGRMRHSILAFFFFLSLPARLTGSRVHFGLMRIIHYSPTTKKKKNGRQQRRQNQQQEDEQRKQ